MDSRVQLMSGIISKGRAHSKSEHTFLNTKIKLQRSSRLVTYHERNVLKLALIIRDLAKSVPG